MIVGLNVDRKTSGLQKTTVPDELGVSADNKGGANSAVRVFRLGDHSEEVKLAWYAKEVAEKEDRRVGVVGANPEKA
ncbi:hypothetical protein A3K29_05145 [Candidatus Collierbacteria bacterium RIFOXYB2_FULL_46_14]|nr:MAG: hypothetical protein A3K29_05145 [Candidatus Collierbacteria bacterium RIFOXYB2_FULL_46_14]OGD76522.1 MAG: hypothetical protein A3K43_05145 [Candidatus Collierbacteria bacterium RIFOXYA2_FULL_46_20]OGD77858.1 MAG: hypothetical protein A3K39_05145 [Candidatus Collierbacteria bacterium RIFOXYC2_FULL_43_15]OGD81148.1 MAG: hypothetical protein A2320_05640 [Pseudomonadales bacterium GWC2_63_15]OGD82580.1 MAG: hypothetical protein A3K36_05145 [Candidatus Collierbacteria bacterium RIFOXYD2_FUL